jgi:subtilase family serine protease
MRKTRLPSFLGPIGTAAFALFLSGWGCSSELANEGTPAGTDRTLEALSQIQQLPHKALCENLHQPGVMHCHARVRTDKSGNVLNFASPTGLNPADLQSAYNIPTSGGSGKIVALVDAQDDPNAESDLAVYRSQFGLPPCTTANGCFQKVNQNGATSPLPAADSGWSGEIALDIEMVSAACPDCKILLIEANSANNPDLQAAEATAIKMGANAISHSWGGPEDSTISAGDASWFNHPGIVVTVSAGDSGYGVEYPASSQYVISVGGTSLQKGTGARG